MFANADAPLLMHPDLTNDPARRKAEPCAPFADAPDQIQPVWRALADRADLIGLSLPPVPETTGDPNLHLLVDGRRHAPVSVAEGRHVFVVPGGSAVLRLVSRSAVPHDTTPWDDRRLGSCCAVGRLGVADPARSSGPWRGLVAAGMA